MLGVAHAVGAGTDADTAWMRAALAMTGAPVLFLFTMRVLPREKKAGSPAKRAGGAAGGAVSAPVASRRAGGRRPRETPGAAA